MVFPLPMPRRSAQSLLVGFWRKIPSSQKAPLSIAHMTPRTAVAILNEPQGEKGVEKRETVESTSKTIREEDQPPEHATYGQVLCLTSCYVR